MISASTQVSSLEPIKHPKASNESSQIDWIGPHLPRVSDFASLPFAYLEISSDRLLSARARFNPTFALSHDFMASTFTY